MKAYSPFNITGSPHDFSLFKPYTIPIRNTSKHLRLYNKKHKIHNKYPNMVLPAVLPLCTIAHQANSRHAGIVDPNKYL